MPQIEIKTKIPTHREYKGLPWQLRDVKKFEMAQATKDAMLLQDKLAQVADRLVLEVGGTAFAENYYVIPVIGVLRKGGWISQDCVVTIQSNEKIKGFIVRI